MSSTPREQNSGTEAQVKMAMAAELPANAGSLPTNAGSLPAWQVNDLPEPSPFGLRHILKLVGPGVVVLGGMIGSGEWLLGPKVTAIYQPYGSLLWFATIGIIAQVWLNTECARYALYTGEPIFTGFLRCKPGAKFWTLGYLLLDCGSIWPGLAFTAATALAAAYLGRLPGVEEKGLVILLGYLVLFLCVLWVSFGGKIYNALEWMMYFKIIYVLGFLLFVGLFFVPWESWKAVLTGFFKFGSVPGEVDWALIAAFAAYAGGGGLSNATISNYVRDKGWGMGSLVGAIPSAIGGKQITLSHIGAIFPLNTQTLRRWKGWWRHILADQYIVWMLGCFLSVALPALLSVEFVAGKDIPEEYGQWGAGAVMAEGLRDKAEVFWPLTLVCGFVVLFTCQLQSIDHIVRRWTDILWTGSQAREKTTPRWQVVAVLAVVGLFLMGIWRLVHASWMLYISLALLLAAWGYSLYLSAGQMSGGQVKVIYYSIFVSYALWGCIAMHLTHPFQMIVLAANINVFAMAFSALHTLYVNRRFLPPKVQPSWWKQISLIACAAYYFFLNGLVIYTTNWRKFWKG